MIVMLVDSIREWFALLNRRKVAPLREAERVPSAIRRALYCPQSCLDQRSVTQQTPPVDNDGVRGP